MNVEHSRGKSEVYLNKSYERLIGTTECDLLSAALRNFHTNKNAMDCSLQIFNRKGNQRDPLSDVE